MHAQPAAQRGAIARARSRWIVLVAALTAVGIVEIDIPPRRSPRRPASSPRMPSTRGAEPRSQTPPALATTGRSPANATWTGSGKFGGALSFAPRGTPDVSVLVVRLADLSPLTLEGW